MRVINYCFFVLLLATQVVSADSGFEQLSADSSFDQLIKINDEAIKKTLSSKALLDEKIKMTLRNLPEYKKYILDLERSWNKTIEKKCRLYTFSSWGTQAITEKTNTCLSDEYLAAAEFFEQLNY